MAKTMKRLLAAVLAIAISAGIALPAFASEATDLTKSLTVWKGDNLSADVTAGENGYTFMSVFRDPAHSYEISNHVLNDGNGNAIPQTLVLVDASKDYTWKPNGEYSFGTNNYEVLYCCDAVTGYVDGVHYKRMNLEDSSYYNGESAAHIRAIITNSYPYVSMEQMKANLAAAGFEGAEDLTRADIIAGVQAAVWYYANESSDFDYLRSYNVAATPGYGKVMNDFTAEMSPAIQALGNKKTLVDNEAGARVEALADYLKGLEKTYAEANQVIITRLEIVGASPIANLDGSFLTTIRVDLNNGGSSELDQIKLDIYVDGQLVKSKDIHKDSATYDVTMAVKAGQTVKAVVSGTQVMPQGVYFYEPEGGRDRSQCLVGVASGETNVYAEEEIVINDISDIPVDKTADPLDKDFITNVTLSVPGNIDSTGVDIIYILGSFLSRDAIETNTMIQCLIDTFADLIKANIPVNFGIVPFSSTKDPVMELTTLDSLEDLEALPDLMAEKIKEAGNVYDSVNMENALVTAKEMFSESELGKAGRTDRQHLVMISSGHTYYFNSGDNNEYISTVPVSFKNGSVDTNEVFYMEKAWMRARNNSTNSYPVPKAFADEYKANPDKYESEWDCYWYYIDLWAKQDIAAGDTVVYEATTREAGDFISWYNSGKYSSNTTYFSYSGNGAVVSNLGNNKIEDVLEFDMTNSASRGVVHGQSGPNPFLDESAAHAIGNERAMWEAYTYIQENITGAGINFYPIYQPLRADGTTSNGSHYDYTWTTNYIGHCFMNMLAGGEAIVYNSTSNKAFFDPIKAEILYTTGIDSYVEDFIGYDPKVGNFEFITDANTILLTVGGDKYITTQVDTKEGATASYAFTAPGAEDPTFWLDYYYGNGKTTEKFIWTFGENVSVANKASLSYKLQLTDMAKDAGEYNIDTNLSATLYAKDSKRAPATPVIFPVPTVQFVVEENNYDVDIVIALGAGIAQYDADNAKYTHTYDSIVNLVKPLIDQGVNVNLGLIAVEHYDDVAMPLTGLTKENYESIITNGLNAIQAMPAGPTNLHGNLVAAKQMLDNGPAPKENKFFYVFATGRTYNFDNAAGVPTTIINQVSLKGQTYYYWGHYLWQSQRGGHTSLYMIPDRYNNSFADYWADVEQWVKADGDTYAYSFTDAYDVTNPQWFNTFYADNSTDAKAMKLASSRFGWILKDLTNSGLAAIGSGSNPQNALNYERAQYEAYQVYKQMAADYNCFAICTESPAYLNESLYITLGAGYKGTSNIQLGHSFMDFLAQADGQEKSTVLFKYVFDANNNPISTDFETTDYFAPIDVSKLVKTEKESEQESVKGPMMMAPAPKQPIVITSQPKGVEAEIGTKFAVTVEAEGEGLTYQWYYMNKNGKEFAPSSFKGKSYAMTMAEYVHLRQVYCVITDAKGNTVTTDIATITRPERALAIIEQPQSVVAEIGDKVTITVNAQGEGLTYQWYYKNKNGTEFAASSYKNKTYTITMAEYCHMREVYCVVTDQNGNTVKTETVMMSRPKQELGEVTVTDNGTVAMGQKATVTVNATGDGLTYQWFYKNKNGKSFAASSYKSKTYSIAMASYCDERQVYCVVTDQYGNSYTTEIITLNAE